MPDPVTTTSDIYPSLIYEDTTAAIDWLCRAFGFTKRLVVPGPDGTVVHSELTLGNGVIMVSSPKPEMGRVGARALEGRTNHCLSVCVANPDAHHARAVAAGAVVVRPLQDEEYGARGYMVLDLEGNPWWFGDYRPGPHWTD